MTFISPIDKINNSLPNGLHDSKLLSMQINYKSRELTLELAINTCDETHNNPIFNSVINLTFTDLLFCIIEPPDLRYFQIQRDDLWLVDYYHVVSEQELDKLPGPLPQEAFVIKCFINDWNSFIFISATNVFISDRS